MPTSTLSQPLYTPPAQVDVTAAPEFLSPFSSSPSSTSPALSRPHYAPTEPISPRTAPSARHAADRWPERLDFSKLKLPASNGNTSASASDLDDVRSPPSLLTSLLFQSRSGSGSKLDGGAQGADGDGLPTPTLLGNGTSRQSSASSHSQPRTPPGTTLPLVPNKKPILLSPRTARSSASTSTTPYTSASEDGRPFGVGLGLSSLSEAVEARQTTIEPGPRLVKRKSCLKFAVQHVSPLSSPGTTIPPALVLPNPARRASVQIDDRRHRPASPPARQRGMVGNGRSCYPSPPRLQAYLDEGDDEIEHIEQASDEGYEEDSEPGFTDESDAEHEDHEDDAYPYGRGHSDPYPASFDSFRPRSSDSHLEPQSAQPDFLRPSAGGLAPPPNPYAYRWPLPSPHRRPSESAVDSYFPPVPLQGALAAAVPQYRRVSLPQNIACPPRCSRHNSPPPQAPLSSPIETAPPAACSPSAAEFVRRRSSRGAADAEPAADEEEPAVLQVGDGRRPSRQWDDLDVLSIGANMDMDIDPEMDGLGALARYAYSRKGSYPAPAAQAQGPRRRGILKRTITSYDPAHAHAHSRVRTGAGVGSGAPSPSPSSGRSGSSTPMTAHAPRAMRRGTAPAALPKVGLGLGVGPLVVGVEGEMEWGRGGEARKELERALKGR